MIDLREYPNKAFLWLYEKAPVIRPTVGAMQQARVFASAIHTNYYASHRKASGNLDNQIRYSKIAECGVRDWMQQEFQLTTNLDFEIRHGAAKGWQPDLQYQLFNVHMKSTDRSYGDRGFSWVLNYGNSQGRGGCDPLIANHKKYRNDFIALTVVEDQDVRILGFIQWGLIAYDEYLEDPHFAHLRDIKRCLYHKTLLAKAGIHAL
jgi:hypothetical protein